MCIFPSLETELICQKVALQEMLVQGQPFIRTVRGKDAPVALTDKPSEHGTVVVQNGVKKIRIHRSKTRSHTTIDVPMPEGAHSTDMKWVHVVIDEPSRERLVHVQKFATSSNAAGGWVKECDAAATNAEKNRRKVETTAFEKDSVYKQDIMSLGFQPKNAPSQNEIFGADKGLRDASNRRVFVLELTMGQSSCPSDAAWWFVRQGFITSTRAKSVARHLSNDVLDFQIEIGEQVQGVSSKFLTIRQLLYKKEQAPDLDPNNYTKDVVDDMTEADIDLALKQWQVTIAPRAGGQPAYYKAARNEILKKADAKLRYYGNNKHIFVDFEKLKDTKRNTLEKMCKDRQLAHVNLKDSTLRKRIKDHALRTSRTLAFNVAVSNTCIRLDILL